MNKDNDELEKISAEVKKLSEDRDLFDALLAELLLKVNTVEKILIDNKIISIEEYNKVFTNSVNKMTDILNQTKKIPEGQVN